MPVASEWSVPAPLRVAVRPSAASELYWALYIGPPGWDDGFPVRSSRFDGHPGLVSRIEDLWGDGMSDYTEVLPLARRAGRLFDLDGDGLVEAMAAAVSDPPDPGSLVSESEMDRARVARRFERLGRDEGMRRRWVALLSDVWAVLAPGWDDAGRDAAVAAARSRSRAVERAVTAADVAALTVDTDPDLLGRMAAWAGSTGAQVAVVPSWMCRRSFILTVEGFLLVGVPADGAGLRVRTEALSRRLKAMADPARLAILERLALRPRTISELTVDVGLAQATVSNHVKLLRQAGLVGRDPAGTRLIVVDGPAVAELLAEVAALLGVADSEAGAPR